MHLLDCKLFFSDFAEDLDIQFAIFESNFILLLQQDKSLSTEGFGSVFCLRSFGFSVLSNFL